MDKQIIHIIFAAENRKLIQRAIEKGQYVQYRVFFKDEETAIAAGYRPCGICMKEKYKDCVLFYRLGDFYEMFFEDAIKVSKLLDLTLTGKDCGLAERAPMCGIPYHAADGYVAKLVSMGERVAICEQVSDPKEAGRGLVERDVVRIVSAGTVIEEDYLDETRNNYIACAFKAGDAVALAWTDITTGEFLTEEFVGENAE